jgi:hypothetical protein
MAIDYKRLGKKRGAARPLSIRSDDPETDERA